MFELSLGFEHIAFKQKKNQVKSRLDINIKSEVLREICLDVPILASNMNTVCNSNFCNLMFGCGGLGIMHRADSEENIIEEVKKIVDNCKLVAASIGVGKNQFEFAKKLVNAGVNIIVIDIAHGYSDEVINLGRKIKKELNVKVIVGNTVNVDMMSEVDDFADAVKVGIANGAACETRNTAGCYERQFSAVFKFKETSKKLGLPIISDGGIREPSDFVKAIGAGANSIMAGSIFARCPESAAELVYVDGKPKKIYAGMASRYVQDKWKGGLKNGTCPEGGVRFLDLGESVDRLVERYTGALRSGITYGGGFDIKSFQDSVEFVRLI